MTSSTKGCNLVIDIFMNDYEVAMRAIMSHSIRQKLISTKRFDVGFCSNQISKLVAQNIYDRYQKNMFNETYYSYDGDRIECLSDKTISILGDRLQGDFYDAFPGIEIEIQAKVDNIVDIDGYYYHTLDASEEDGLIEVVVSISPDYMKISNKESLSISIQSVLAHEMQHVVQRCYGGIDMEQIHDKPESHLTDIREIDARVEEVLVTIDNEQDDKLFMSRMTAYIEQYIKRNNVSDCILTESVRIHTEFYKEKMLEHFHKCANMQNETARGTQMPYSMKVPSIIV